MEIRKDMGGNSCVVLLRVAQCCHREGYDSSHIVVLVSKSLAGRPWPGWLSG